MENQKNKEPDLSNVVSKFGKILTYFALISLIGVIIDWFFYIFSNGDNYLDLIYKIPVLLIVFTLFIYLSKSITKITQGSKKHPLLNMRSFYFLSFFTKTVLESISDYLIEGISYRVFTFILRGISYYYLYKWVKTIEYNSNTQPSLSGLGEIIIVGSLIKIIAFFFQPEITLGLISVTGSMIVYISLWILGNRLYQLFLPEENMNHSGFV